MNMALRLISTDAFLATHVNARKFLSLKLNGGEIKSVELKQVERGSTFTLTSDLSGIASILFANVILRTYTRKNYATLEINP